MLSYSRSQQVQSSPQRKLVFLEGVFSVQYPKKSINIFQLKQRQDQQFNQQNQQHHFGTFVHCLKFQNDAPVVNQANRTSLRLPKLPTDIGSELESEANDGGQMSSNMSSGQMEQLKGHSKSGLLKVKQSSDAGGSRGFKWSHNPDWKADETQKRTELNAFQTRCALAPFCRKKAFSIYFPICKKASTVLVFV